MENHFTHLKVYKIVGFWNKSNCVKVIDDYGDIVNASGFRFGLRMRKKGDNNHWERRTDYERNLPKPKVAGLEASRERIESWHKEQPCTIVSRITRVDNIRINHHYCIKHNSEVEYPMGVGLGECNAIRDLLRFFK